jgi:hypothetical protein
MTALVRRHEAHGQQTGRRVDAVGGPQRLAGREGLQLQAAAGAQHQHPRVEGRALGQQDPRHALHVGEAGDEFRRALVVARHHVRIVKMGHRISSRVSS